MTALKASGSEVHALALDTASDECVLRLEAALAGLPKLAGIIHAAVVTADATIGNLTPEAMALCAKKAAGAKHLDALSRRLGAKLDFFVLYSSATVLLGNPGQANYVAGNARSCGRRPPTRRAPCDGDRLGPGGRRRHAEDKRKGVEVA